MRLFKCEAQTVTMQVIDLPRSHWRLLPPRRLQVVATLAGIAVTALLWGVLS